MRNLLGLISLVLTAIQRLVNVALTVLIVGALLLFVIPFVRVAGFAKLSPVLTLHHYGDPVLARFAVWLHALHVPTPKGYLALEVAIAGYVLVVISDRLFGLLHTAVDAYRQRLLMRKPKPVAAEKVTVDDEKTREQLYKQFRQIEKTLKSAKRTTCTFLSVDVVGSTTMKSGESEVAITATFRAYEELLKRTFVATHAWKQSWTPDGVMICFQKREDAVAAAKTILEKLRDFNRVNNQLKTKLDVRCGVNEGDVVIFEDSEVEKLVEHVIDVAGHMQKYATPGSLLLSADLYRLLEDQSGFVSTGKDVDGYQTYEWTPQPAERAETATSLKSP
ncbi:MAG TPA: adenylate/guanylate cyclase domain-containing protein [Candidatus Baltobacteraceae bacterium]|nr:adenylate/guanylate cyclase domain-containing protein [Candidatus Baltobacteraceae bacterium]